MKIIKLVVLVIVITGLYAPAAFAEFTVSAEVTRSAVFKAEMKTVADYFRNVKVFEKNFPGVISVQELGGGESKWVYEVDAPLSSPVRMPFILKEVVSTDDYIVFETKKSEPDYFRSSARIITLGENETRLSITIKIKMVRESGSDVHFMAPLLGEKFISKEMKKDITEALETFLSKCKKEI
jgi:hypothetical protein